MAADISRRGVASLGPEEAEDATPCSETSVASSKISGPYFHSTLFQQPAPPPRFLWIYT